MRREFSFSCCGEQMLCPGLLDTLTSGVDSTRRWICPVYGHGADLVHFNFDQIELRMELERYGASESPVHIQQLKGGGKENGAK
jgi:hypothetical protein